MKNSNDVYKEDFSFLINCSTVDFQEWINQATDDDIAYALELFTMNKKNNSEFTEANVVLNKFRIK
jgi:hypothetical protein